MKTNDIKQSLLSRKDRSAWDRGVTMYALDLLDIVDQSEEIDPENVVFASLAQARRIMLNGADDWKQYSYGGCSLIYDCDIASTLCTPSELARKRGGELPPNSRDKWLDVQARALHQASRRMYSAYSDLSAKEA